MLLEHSVVLATSDFKFLYAIDYIYYLHEPHEENHLLMSVYPYEIPLIYMDSENQNGMGGIDIIYKKEIVSKIPGKGADLGLSLNSKSADYCKSNDT